MKVALDIDGVLAEFIPSYQALFVKVTGRDAFAPGDNVDPPAWDWPYLRGYTKDETAAVWSVIKKDETFWLNLQATDNCLSLRTLLNTLERKHDVYYITSRMGARAKRQTEIWLFDRLVYPMRAPGIFPTALIVGHRVKGQMCRALGIDAYIDDNFDNVTDCLAQSPHTRTYLLSRTYNQSEQRVVLVQDPTEPSQMMARPIERVNTLGEMFDREIALGNL